MSGKSIPVLKKRLKEKSDALKQCEEDVNNLVKERRKGSDSFLVSQGEIITEVVQRFDQLASVLTRKRDQLLLHLKDEMKELHASSSARDCEEVEQLQEKLKKVSLRRQTVIFHHLNCCVKGSWEIFSKLPLSITAVSQGVTRAGGSRKQVGIPVKVLVHQPVQREPFN